MHYSIFVTNFQKSPRAGGFPLPPHPAPLTFNIPWFGQIVVFEADYDEIELHKYSYDVISLTSSTLRHGKTSPK